MQPRPSVTEALGYAVQPVSPFVKPPLVTCSGPSAEAAVAVVPVMMSARPAAAANGAGPRRPGKDEREAGGRRQRRGHPLPAPEPASNHRANLSTSSSWERSHLG